LAAECAKPVRENGRVPFDCEPSTIVTSESSVRSAIERAGSVLAPLAAPVVKERPMTYAPAEPTIEEFLTDPVIGALMRADKVDPQHFADLLRSVARRGNRPPTLPVSPPRARALARPLTPPVRASHGLCGCLASW